MLAQHTLFVVLSSVVIITRAASASRTGQFLIQISFACIVAADCVHLRGESRHHLWHLVFEVGLATGLPFSGLGLLHGESGLLFYKNVLFQRSKIKRPVHVTGWRIQFVGATSMHLLFLCSHTCAVVKIGFDGIDAAPDDIIHHVFPHHFVADGRLREQVAIITLIMIL